MAALGLGAATPELRAQSPGPGGNLVQPAPAASPDHPREETRPWSFAPVRDPSPPPVRDTAWPATSIDRFVLAALEARGLQPAPPADRRALIRRARFDLTGLPPTPEEVDAFLADPGPDAFARVVDRLLASRHYGEHWGRHWLDVVRYADTAGDTADYPLPEAWRYRNYVIDSFNADKPYDEFIREQVAGDILARQGSRERYAERVTATGFLAISRRFGFDSENYHHLTIQDTIDTLGQSVLGLTVGCARCHDHKFDPIPMRDYYALYGIFESTRYAFPGSEQKGKYRAMIPLVPAEEALPRWRDFQAGFAALGMTPGSVLRSLDDLDGDFEMQRAAAGGSNGVLVPPWFFEGKVSVAQAAQSPFKHLHPFGGVGASVAPAAGDYAISQMIHPSRTRGLVHVNLEFRTTANTPAARGRHRFLIGARGGPPAVEAFISAETLELSGAAERLTIRLPKPGDWHCLQLVLDLNSRTFTGSVGLPGTTPTFAVRPFAPDATGTIDFVAIDSQGAAGEPLPGLDVDNIGVQESPIPPVSTTPAAAAASVPTLAELKSDLQALTDRSRKPPAPAGVPGADGAGPPEPSRDAEISGLRRKIEGRTAEEEKRRRELEAQLAAGPVALAYGVSEGTPHDARLHVRGEPDHPGPGVPRGFIQALGAATLPAGATGSGRLELARWLTRSDHPLTARVMVNRLWQFHFGRGLVRTPNDFGNRSEPPTNPELLDHLATRFLAQGQSIKAMHRLIMLSATWRQACLSGESAPGAAELHAGFSRRRLSAEEIRDAILSVSGALDITPGEGHPFPAPHTWGFTQHEPFAAVYDHDKRSVYLMVQRIKRHPFLALFDGADPNSSTPGRAVTTVPSQALYFLNDPFVHAKALKCAERLEAAAAGERDRIDLATKLAFGRPPTESEQAGAAEFLAAYRAELGAAGTANPGLAALAAYVRTLIGSNEFLHCD